MTVTGFCERLGIPRSSWYRWRAVGTDTKGPWPTPAQDVVETDAKTLAGDWDGWSHRKLAELRRVGIDDVAAGEVSDSTMFRVLDRNGLCLPANYTSEVRHLAGIGKETFIDPPKRRNRLWRADFSEYETSAAGVWNLGGVVDYWAEVNPACEVSIRKTTKDAIVFFEAALDEVEELLGVSWMKDLTDPDTGQIGTLRIVTDNGSCFKSGASAAWVASKRHIVHIRTHKEGAVDQRDDRTVLRIHQIRTSLPPRNRRRSHSRRRGRHLPEGLQHDPTPRSHQHDPTPRPLSDHPKTKPSRPEICLRFLTRDRLSTIRNADRVVVVEAGRITGVGRFDELARSHSFLMGADH